MARALFQSRKPLFWEQIRQGQLAGDAGEAVGASATCGRWWFREAGGVKPAVSAPNTSGPRPRLTLEERIEIQAGVHADESMRSIADRLKRAPSTIKREIDNNTELRTRKNPKKSGYRRSMRSAPTRAAPRRKWPTGRWPPTTAPPIALDAPN